MESIWWNGTHDPSVCWQAIIQNSFSFCFNWQGKREYKSQIDNSHKPFEHNSVPLPQIVLSALKVDGSSSGQVADEPEHVIEVLHSLSCRHSCPEG